jgi:methanethiol S-methyltransferase
MITFTERAFVWSGGVLFVGSLALTAWTYGVPFSNVPPAFDWSALAVDVLLVTVFAAHHSVFARDTVKRALGRWIPERLLRSVYVWAASLLLVLVCLAWQPIGGELYRMRGTSRWLAVSAQITGVWMIASSVRAIRPLELAGIRSARKSDPLQNHGPYALVRHPLYLGWMLMVFGAAHMTGDRLAFAIITAAYLVIAIPWEERALERSFEESYRAYKREVRWRVIPYVY